MIRTKYTNLRWGLDGSFQTILVENGLVIERSQANLDGPVDEVIDLNQQWVLPQFVDNHSHIEATGTYLGYPTLVNCNTKESVLSQLRDALKPSPPILIAIQYDQNRWGGDHLSLTELDTISAQIPILIKHSNGHAGVCNSAAFQLANVAPSELDPPSGQFGRDASGQLNGVLYEGALERVTRFFPSLNFEQMKDSIRRGLQKVKSLGYQEVSDMGSNGLDPSQLLQAYGAVAEEPDSLEMRLYLHWKDVFGPRAIHPELIQQHRALIAGVKIFADGAIGSATAAIYGKFTSNPKSQPAGGKSRTDAASATNRAADGLLMYPPDRLTEMVCIATEAGFQVATHAIGDLAVDLVMNAYEASGEPARHRIEHAMILSDEQIDRLVKLGCFVSVQPEFLSRFGDAYRTQLGPERGSQLIRTKSMRERGVKVSASTDRPIVEGDPLLGLQMLRTRPFGFTEQENIGGAEALPLWLGEASLANGTAPQLLMPGQPFRANFFQKDPRELQAGDFWTASPSPG